MGVGEGGKLGLARIRAEAGGGTPARKVAARHGESDELAWEACERRRMLKEVQGGLGVPYK